MSLHRVWYPFTAFILALALNANTVSAEDRVLTFPEKCVGRVYRSQPPSTNGSDLLFDEMVKEVREAKGRVLFNEAGLIGLEVAASKELAFLKDLPPNLLGSLTITGASLSQLDMQHIARLQSLIGLELQDCEFAPDAFTDLGQMSELLRISISSPSLTDDSSHELVTWIASLPKVRMALVSPKLALENLQLLTDRGTLTHMSVRLGRDAKQVLDCLEKLPKLDSLSLFIEKDIAPDALMDLGKLKHLRSIRWFSGRIDGAILKQIAANDRLEQLTLSQVELGEGLGDALESLTRLSELVLIPSDNSKLPTNLVDHLLRMPQLRKWPRLEKVNAKALERICTTKHIESLTLQGMASDVTRDHLARIRQITSLKQLDLQGIPVDDAWLNGLSELAQLNSLRLWDTSITGEGLIGLQLPKLEEAHLWFAASMDDLPIKPNLSGLKWFPNLKSVHIGGDLFQPSDLEPLKECLSLTDLRLWGGGFSDDSTAEWIAELPNLSRLSLEGNCVVTDRGALALSKLRNLQRLSVGGFISPESIMLLDRIPSIRQLFVSSSNVSPEEEAKFRPGFSTPVFFTRAYSGNVIMEKDGSIRKERPGEKRMVTGKDGLLRLTSDDQTLRARMDLLEGKPATTLDPKFVNISFAKELNKLQGKVVILDFWGTWCGPCRMQIGKLKELYTQHHDAGLEIIGIHTEAGASELAQFVKDRSVPWLNLVDNGDEIGSVFQIAAYPSLFIIDRKGMVRIALAHPLGLQQAIERLLKE